MFSSHVIWGENLLKFMLNVLSGAKREELSLMAPPTPSVHLHTTPQINTWIFPTSVKHVAIHLSALLFLQKACGSLLTYLKSGGRKKHPDLAKAEQTRNFDVRDGRKIPRRQPGCYLCSKQHPRKIAKYVRIASAPPRLTKKITIFKWSGLGPSGIHQECGNNATIDGSLVVGYL